MKAILARRQFLSLTASAVAGVLLEGGAASTVATDLRVQAIAFDAFPIFDPRPVFALAEQLFPGRGGELSNEWRTRQFEYTWLRVAAGHYADFWHVTQDALEFASNKLSLELSPEKRKKLMSAYLELKPWPDVPAALTSLKQSGFRLAFLSNFTRAMLDANIESAGLAGRFEQIISTDRAKTYKPDPRAYKLGVDSQPSHGLIEKKCWVKASALPQGRDEKENAQPNTIQVQHLSAGLQFYSGMDGCQNCANDRGAG